jgi:hypothetical protein
MLAAAAPLARARSVRANDRRQPPPDSGKATFKNQNDGLPQDACVPAPQGGRLHAGVGRRMAAPIGLLLLSQPLSAIRRIILSHSTTDAPYRQELF